MKMIIYLMSSSEANRTTALAYRVSSSRRMILSKSDGLWSWGIFSDWAIQIPPAETQNEGPHQYRVNHTPEPVYFLVKLKVQHFKSSSKSSTKGPKVWVKVSVSRQLCSSHVTQLFFFSAPVWNINISLTNQSSLQKNMFVWATDSPPVCYQYWTSSPSRVWWELDSSVQESMMVSQTQKPLRQSLHLLLPSCLSLLFSTISVPHFSVFMFFHVFPFPLSPPFFSCLSFLSCSLMFFLSFPPFLCLLSAGETDWVQTEERTSRWWFYKSWSWFSAGGVLLSCQWWC